jgi:hypothetical protein
MCPCASGTPSSVGNSPTMMWTEMPARKPVVTGIESRVASQPARSRPTATRTMPTRRAKQRGQLRIMGGAGDGDRGQRAAEDRRDGRVGRDRHEAVGAERGKGERPGGKRIEPCRRWHSRQPGGRELARDRDRRQHEPGDQITWQPSDPIAAQRCEQPGPAFGFRYLPVLAALAAGFAPAFALRTAAWYLRRMSAMFTCADGSYRPISSIVSAMICDIARSRNHL